MTICTPQGDVGLRQGAGLVQRCDTAKKMVTNALQTTKKRGIIRKTRGATMAEWQYKYREEEWNGKRYGNLTITGYDRKERKFICRCDCGTEGKRVKPSFLFNGKVQTCGLKCPIHIDKPDHRSDNRTYGIWNNMKRRCYNQNSNGYYLYGGRGIKVCDEWLNDYWAFHDWAMEHGYRDDLTIDRINGDGNYEPSNCRWATVQEQRDNARNPYTFVENNTAKRHEINGVYKTMKEWCNMYGVSEPFVRYRMKKKGMTLQEALETPKLQDGRPSGH